MKKAPGRIMRKLSRSSIRYTVFLSFTFSALLAIVMTGITFYMRFSKQLQSTLQSESEILVEQVNQSLGTHLRNMLRLSDSIAYNVVKNKDISSPEINAQMQLLYNTNSSYVKNIALFSADGEALVAAPPAKVKPEANVVDTPWFQRTMERSENLIFFTPVVQNVFVDAGNQYSWVFSLSCVVEITRNKSTEQGVLLLDLYYGGISELFENVALANDGYVYLVDSDGHVIYHPQHQLLSSGLIAENNIAHAAFQDGVHELSTPVGNQSVIVRSVGYTGWKVIGVIPERGISMNALQNLLYVLIIFFLYFEIIILVNAFISSRLMEPIQKLEESVRALEQDMDHGEIYVGGSQEIWSLGNSVQQMVNRLRELTDKIVAEHEQKQKSELNALQAQINPHFLYNTLDILVWMIEKGQPDEALRIVSALARFFRLSLSKGKNIISVGDELEHARNYLMIQQMRYKNKFIFKINAEPGTENLSTIKLVVQPIVENAIYHGMDFMDGDGEIDIRAYLRDGDLYITVADNGLGMPQEIVDRLLTENSPGSMGSGIGLKNVHERVRLYFGEKYGVIIESEPDVGSRITLHLPAIPFGETEDK